MAEMKLTCCRQYTLFLLYGHNGLIGHNYGYTDAIVGRMVIYFPND